MDGKRAERFSIASTTQLARNQRIRGAGRNAQVILKNVPDAIVAFYQIDARDMGVNTLWWRNSLALRKVTGRGECEGFRHYPVFDDALFAVQVTQVGIQRIHALDKPAFQVVPLGSSDDARNGIERKQTLFELPLLVQPELNAVARKLGVDLGSLLNQLRIHP